MESSRKISSPCSGGGTSSSLWDLNLTPQKGNKSVAFKILLLDDSVTIIQAKPKATAQLLFNQLCRQLNLIENDYFGLNYKDKVTHTIHFLDLNKKLNAQAGLDLEQPLLTFCVKFYTPDPDTLQQVYTRYLFSLQIKRDLATGEFICCRETKALIASYIVQAECGDFDEHDYPDANYLSLYKFTKDQDEDLQWQIRENHRKHKGQSPAQADLNLLLVARRTEFYGLKFHQCKDDEGVLMSITVCHSGLLVYQNQIKVQSFSWPKIKKISFKRKKFFIKLNTEMIQPTSLISSSSSFTSKDTIEFNFDTRDDCKTFWKRCVEHHAFFRCDYNSNNEKMSVASIDSPESIMPNRKLKKKSNSSLLGSRGSSFRYSGRTQKEVLRFVKENFVVNDVASSSNPIVYDKLPCDGKERSNLGRTSSLKYASSPTSNDIINDPSDDRGRGRIRTNLVHTSRRNGSTMVESTSNPNLSADDFNSPQKDYVEARRSFSKPAVRSASGHKSTSSPSLVEKDMHRNDGDDEDSGSLCSSGGPSPVPMPSAGKASLRPKKTNVSADKLSNEAVAESGRAILQEGNILMGSSTKREFPVTTYKSNYCAGGQEYGGATSCDQVEHLEVDEEEWGTSAVSEKSDGNAASKGSVRGSYDLLQSDEWDADDDTAGDATPEPFAEKKSVSISDTPDIVNTCQEAEVEEETPTKAKTNTKTIQFAEIEVPYLLRRRIDLEESNHVALSKSKSYGGKSGVSRSLRFCSLDLLPPKETISWRDDSLESFGVKLWNGEEFTRRGGSFHGGMSYSYVNKDMAASDEIRAAVCSSLKRGFDVIGSKVERMAALSLDKHFVGTDSNDSGDIIPQSSEELTAVPEVDSSSSNGALKEDNVPEEISECDTPEGHSECQNPPLDPSVSKYIDDDLEEESVTLREAPGTISTDSLGKNERSIPEEFLPPPPPTDLEALYEDDMEEAEAVRPSPLPPPIPPHSDYNHKLNSSSESLTSSEKPFLLLNKRALSRISEISSGSAATTASKQTSTDIVRRINEKFRRRNMSEHSDSVNNDYMKGTRAPVESSDQAPLVTVTSELGDSSATLNDLAEIEEEEIEGEDNYGLDGECASKTKSKEPDSIENSLDSLGLRYSGSYYREEVRFWIGPQRGELIYIKEGENDTSFSEVTGGGGSVCSSAPSSRVSLHVEVGGEDTLRCMLMELQLRLKRLKLDLDALNKEMLSSGDDGTIVQLKIYASRLDKLENLIYRNTSNVRKEVWELRHGFECLKFLSKHLEEFKNFYVDWKVTFWKLLSLIKSSSDLTYFGSWTVLLDSPRQFLSYVLDLAVFASRFINQKKLKDNINKMIEDIRNTCIVSVDVENKLKIIECNNELDGSELEEHIDTLGMFIRQGALLHFENNKISHVICYLFSNKLIISNRVNKVFSVQGILPTGKISTSIKNDIKGLELEIFDDDPESHTKYTFGCFSQEQLQQWYNDLNRASELSKHDQQDNSEHLSPEQKSIRFKIEANSITHVCWHRNFSVDLEWIKATRYLSMCGYLMRKFKTASGWQKLFVVFQNVTLYFFKNDKDTTCLASLPLLGYTVTESDEYDCNKVFKLQYKAHIYFFKCLTTFSFLRWMQVLKAATSTAYC